jgi:hypothetical protein
MEVKLNYIYKNQDGEYFKCVDDRGVLVLKNPSYPFVFLPQVLEPLEEIGKADEFEHLIVTENHEFHEGETLSVSVKSGKLEVDKKG